MTTTDGFSEAERAAMTERAAELEAGGKKGAKKADEALKPSEKFGSRYVTVGFEDPATLDDDNVWSASYAVTKLTKADEEFLASLVQTAVGG